MSIIKRKIKLTNLLNWVYDVFGIGMNDEHRKVWFENQKIINSTMNVTREFYHVSVSTAKKNVSLLPNIKKKKGDLFFPYFIERVI